MAELGQRMIIDPSIPKLLDRHELAARLAELRSRGQTVVFTNGCFDLLHVGHLRYLQEARSLGDCLVVGVNSDDSVRRLKGPSRPLVGELERAEMLAGLACVDYVTLFGEDTPVELIRLLKPDVHVKGGDYKIEELPEAEVVRSYGGRVVLAAVTRGRSTTELVQRILSNGKR